MKKVRVMHKKSRKHAGVHTTYCLLWLKYLLLLHLTRKTSYMYIQHDNKHCYLVFAVHHAFILKNSHK